MAIEDITPTLEQIASHIPSRTKEKGTGGTYANTFNDNTWPTGDLVTARTEKFMERFGAKLGDIDDNFNAAAAEVASIGIAAQVELGFWPEQIKNDRSPYTELKEEFKTALEELLESLASAPGNGDDGGESGSFAGGLPSYGFPEDGGGMVNWGTEF